MLSRHAASTPDYPSTIPRPTMDSGMDGTQTLRHAHGPAAIDPEVDPTPPSATPGAAINIKPPTQPEPCRISPSTANRSFPKLKTGHQRQQSVPNFPSSSTSNQPIPQVTLSPSTDRGSGRPLSVNMALTGDNRSRKSADASRGGILSGWFTGSGSPNGAEGTSPTTQAARTNNDNTDETPSMLRRRATADQTPKGNSPSTSRFAFFTSPFSKNNQGPVDPKQHEELLNLNIQEALFPPSSPTQRDAFSPAAFKNLEATAVGLLTKFQSAYQRQNAVLQDLRDDKDAQVDESEEADTRIQHLKVQLENMASKVAEQEQSIQQLMAELAAEKKARQEERLMRERGRPISEGSSISEDLGVEEDQARRKWRKSVGFETDDESVEDASVFSRSRSPTTAAPSVFEGSITELSPAPSVAKANTLGPPKASRPTASKTPQQQTSVFQKLMRGVTGDPKDQGGSSSCANCRGQDERAAWDTVSLLRDENRGLKHRVAELETCVDSALDAVNGIRLD
ncbi:uncharacterized protein CTRU02_212736 [Colletotrichum truncatum]|uniref:Uncharacterized protein n=1 Tax=Colletotrichum truncatum TaxID=5467 RepID=A0ACC3YIT1_COLTU|nr:uncharacterized protein CTRU02_05187 [Colletotrichum truncatum]KAF6794355.1 hypothetical protein CTRU02_05187 [Colletotrichum truncatum]